MCQLQARLKILQPVLPPRHQHEMPHSEIRQLAREFLAQSGRRTRYERCFSVKGCTRYLSVCTWMACKTSFPTTRSETTTIDSPGPMPYCLMQHLHHAHQRVVRVVAELDHVRAHAEVKRKAAANFLVRREREDGRDLRPQPRDEARRFAGVSEHTKSPRCASSWRGTPAAAFIRWPALLKTMGLT